MMMKKRELNMDQLAHVSGGVLTEDDKAYIRKYAQLMKSCGKSLDDLRRNFRGESLAYLESIWDEL